MSREVMTMALEALELHGKEYPHMVENYCLKAITALREALAQPEQWTPEDTAYRPGGIPQAITQTPQEHSSNEQFTPDWDEKAVMVEEMQRMAKQIAEMKSEQEPILQDIEQYRMQMAGICTAALGYWKEGDGIHPDYDTLALRDVAKLYAKYDALYKSQSVPHGVIAGALFDFMAWLTTRDERLVLSSADEASPAVDAIRDFAKMRDLSLDDARVQDWQDILQAIPQIPQEHSSNRQWVGLTDEEIEKHWKKWVGTDRPNYSFARAIEAKLKEKNT